MYFNFPLLVIKSHDIGDFVNMMVIVDSVFLAFVFVTLLCAKRLFQSDKQAGLKDSVKLFVQILSLTMVFFLTISQLPMLTLNIQGYLCNEDLSLTYVIDVDCGSNTHYATIAIATVSLITYLVFILLQR